MMTGSGFVVLIAAITLAAWLLTFKARHPFVGTWAHVVLVLVAMIGLVAGIVLICMGAARAAVTAEGDSCAPYPAAVRAITARGFSSVVMTSTVRAAKDVFRAPDGRRLVLVTKDSRSCAAPLLLGPR